MGYIETAYNGPNELDIHDAKLRDIISLAFSEIKAYAKDDYCLYGDTLYVFTSAHPVGPWTGTDVRATSVDEELKSRSSTDSYTKEEVDDLLEDKADVSYVDDELATKANQATTYTKTETDTLLSAKANQSTTYTKTEVDTALSGKADKATTYTKEQVDALVSAVFRYKGTKATVADLEAVTEKAVGDVWFVSADSSEYAWNGTVWEKLGPVIDLSGYLTSLTVAGITLDSTHTTITSAQLITALNIYTQTEVDTALNAKADKSTTYTKTETDTLLSTKANQSTVDDLPTNATEMPLSSQDQTTVKDAIDGLGAVMTGATSSTAGAKGLVPAPAAGDERKFLRADGTWVIVQAEGQSVGFLPIIATLAVLDWVQSGTDYVCRITNLAITSSMYVSGLSFVDEVNIPGVVTPTIDANNHQVVLTTDVQPLNAVVAYIECAVDGATVLQDVSQLTTPFVGATASADGRQGLVPKPFIADRRKLLRADGTWDDAQASEVVYGSTNVGAALSAQSDQIANVVITNEYSTILDVVNAYSSVKAFPFTIQKNGISVFTDLPTDMPNTSEWNLIVYGSQLRTSLVLSGFYNGVAIDNSYYRTIYSGSYMMPKWLGFADADKIGDLTQLQTTAKNNLVAAVNENHNKISKHFEYPQITDTNAFVNDFGIFNDWTGYLNSKTGRSGDDTKYVICLRLPCIDYSGLPLLAIRHDMSIMHLYKLNMTSNTITYMGKLTFTS